MTQEMISALKDSELEQLIAWAHREEKIRVELKKRETVAKIRDMAQSVGISVSIAGVRGRPKKAKD